MQYTISQKLYRKFTDTPADQDKLPLGALVGCGAASGAFTSVILTPIELIKCKMQVQTIPGAAAAGVKHPGPFRLIADIYKAYGLRGFWHGQMGTFFRETGGSAAFLNVTGPASDM